MSASQLTGQGEGRFDVSGDLSFDTVVALLSDSAQEFATFTTLAIDLGGVQRADSAGIALLLEWVRRARRQKKSLSFSRIPPQMSAIIQISNLQTLLPIAD